MNIIIVKDYEEMSRRAAHLFVAQMLNNPASVLGLATGSTPLGLYRELIRYYDEGMISFEHAHAFNLDEYIGLEHMHPQSYSTFMETHFFQYVDMPKAHRHIPSGVAANPSAEALNYDRAIAAAGGIDLQVLGIGRNGHIGFNEPDVKFEALTHVVELDEQTLSDNARFFSSVEAVPQHAISMGIKTIMQSKRIILLASGAEKADAVEKMLSGSITPELPASVLQLHPSATVILDEAAARAIDSEALKDIYAFTLPRTHRQ